MRMVLQEFCEETKVLEEELDQKVSIKTHQEERFNILINNLSTNQNKVRKG